MEAGSITTVSTSPANEESAKLSEETRLTTSPNRDYWTSDNFSVLDAKDLGRTAYTYVLVRENGNWEILGEVDKVKGDLSNENIELVSFDPTSGTLRVPFFVTCTKGKLQSRTECSCAKGVFGETRSKHGYQLCTSNFKKLSIDPINALSTVLGTAMGAVIGTTSVVYRVDTDAVLAAAKEAKLINHLNKKTYELYVESFSRAQGSASALKSFIAKAERLGYDPDRLMPLAEAQIAQLTEKAAIEAKEKQLAQYRTAFERATTSAELASFIQSYGNVDPDRLIPIARERLKLAEAAEAKERERQRELALKDAALQRRAAEEEAQRLAAWRNGLKIGDETNCGPVLERKPGLIKIYFPVANYGNEHWLKLDQVDRAGMGCRFVNGRYMPS